MKVFSQGVKISALNEYTSAGDNGYVPIVIGGQTMRITGVNLVAGALALKAPINNPNFTGAVTLPAATSIGLVNSTHLSYLQGVTSNVQTQLNGKLPSTDLVWNSGVLTVTGSLQPTLNFIGNNYLNATSSNNSQLLLQNTGILLSRNIADANPAVVVNQVHVSSTG